MPWTRQQQEIIDARNCNLLVSAAAGSGKTAVLVERIVQMVLDEKNPMNLDEMLVVTFTKAAASQMRERIEAKLEEELAKQPANEHLLKQILLIHRAQITTIHSFCMDTVKNYFYQLSLDPNFRIGEEGEISLLKQEVLEEILEEQYEQASEPFLMLVESYAPGKSDKAIEQLILKIYEFCISSPTPKKWLEEAKNGFLVKSEEELSQTSWMQNLLKNAKKQLVDCQSELIYALDGDILPPKMEEMIQSELAILNKLMDAPSYEECREILEQVSFKRWPTLTKKDKEAGYSKEEIDVVKEMRDDAKKTLQDVKEKFFFYDLSEQLRQIKKVAPVIEVMVDLVLAFYERFSAKKREKNVFEFHDLEHFALELFVEEYEGEGGLDLVAKPSEIAMEFKSRYREIFIDEYQDSNMVQELLLTAISKEKTDGNLFMVGDMKQSIYKFRMARPEIFQKKYERYEEGQVRDKKIELRNNFRSRWEVLEAANYIFYQTMQEDFAKMTYDDKNRLVPSRQFPDWNGEQNRTELLLLNLGKEETQDEEGAKREPWQQGAEDEIDETTEEYTKLELEAKLIAKRIKELVEGDFFVEDEKNQGEKRKVKYKDIAILLRTMQGTAEVLEEVLSENKIPVHLDNTRSSFHSVEIKTTVSLLEIVDNVYLDIPLVAVLRSPIVAVSGEELALIRNLVVHEKRSSYSFYEYLHFYLESGKDEKLKKKLSGFLEILEQLREEKTYLTIEDLIWSAFEKTGYYQYVKGMPNGARRQANLDMLMQKAAKYEDSSYRGLFQFIRYIRQLNNYEEEFGQSGGLVEDDAVRITSIHKSKGLEFPIVFVSCLSKQFNYMDVNQKIVLHQDYYIGVDEIDYVNRERIPTLKKKFLQEQLKLEMLQEELRVLYVALTRAQEKLILTATVNDLGKLIQKPFGTPSYRKKGLSYLTMMRGRTYLDWILAALSNEKCTDLLFYNFGVQKEENISYLEEDKDLFFVKVIAPQQIVGEKVLETLEQDVTKEQLLNKKWRGDKDEKEKIYEIFDYQYPNQAAIEARGKWSVSEFKRTMPQDDEDRQAALLIQESKNEEKEVEEEDDFVKTVPSFIEEKEQLVSAAKGTAVHKILELLDFSKIENQKELERQMRVLLESEKIDEREYQAGKKTYLYSLFQSDIGKRMVEAAKGGHLQKEKQFMIGVPMREVEQEKDSDELVLIQGIIDLYFEEEDGIVILDYKTDYIKKGEEQSWVLKYEPQLRYYKKALEQMTGKRVKETYLYAFSRRAFYKL